MDLACPDNRFNPCVGGFEKKINNRLPSVDIYDEMAVGRRSVKQHQPTERITCQEYLEQQTQAGDDCNALTEDMQQNF